MKMIAAVLLALTLAGCTSTAAPVASTPAPGSDEFQVETTVLAAYNVISNPAGRRDWNRFEALFAPGATILQADDPQAKPMSTADYVAVYKPQLMTQSWFERPVNTTIHVYGNVAQVWSVYEGRESASQENATMRGVKSFTLIRAGSEWKIQSIVWQKEDAAHPLPAARASS
jgi:hypothetical protein